MIIIDLHHYCVDAWLVCGAHVCERNLHGWLSGHKVVLDVTILIGFKTMRLSTSTSSVFSFDFCFHSLRYGITIFNFWFYVLTLFNSGGQIFRRSVRRYLRLIDLLDRPQVWHFNEVRSPYPNRILMKLDVSSEHLEIIIEGFEDLLHSFRIRDVLHHTLVWTLDRVKWNVETQLVIGDLHEVMRILNDHALAENDHSVPVKLGRFLSLSKVEGIILHIIDWSCTLRLPYKVSGVVAWWLLSFLDQRILLNRKIEVRFEHTILGRAGHILIIRNLRVSLHNSQNFLALLFLSPTFWNVKLTLLTLEPMKHLQVLFLDSLGFFLACLIIRHVLRPLWIDRLLDYAWWVLGSGR